METCENINFLGTPLKEKFSSLCCIVAKILKNALIKKNQMRHCSQYFASSEYFTPAFIY